jgi:F420-non-reducing hydrogenase large subunit
LPYSYGKQILLKTPKAENVVYRVGPLARLNCADAIETPLANAELAAFKKAYGNPCHQIVLGHYARLIEMVYAAEKAVQILADPESGSANVRTQPTGTPRRAAAHVEAPRGVLVHDYDVDKNGIVLSANFLVATQHNIACINTSIKDAAKAMLGKPDAEFLNGIEFAIRCYDPCLSCSTHKIGEMQLDVSVVHQGQVLRQVRR